MAKLKDRRAAHRVVAELIWKARDVLPELGASPGVMVEIEKIRESHFAIGTIVDDLPDDHEVLEPGVLAMGGIYHCNGCNAVLEDKTKRLCAACEAKVEPETPKNGSAA